MCPVHRVRGAVNQIHDIDPECRVGHHSTSDDSFAYRPRQEVEEKKRLNNPHARLRSFLESRGWWNNEEEENAKARFKEEVLRAFKRAETMQRPPLSEMFEDVYAPGHETWMIVSSVLTSVTCVAHSSYIPLTYSLRILFIEGAARTTQRSFEEVRGSLGAMEDGVEEVQGGREGFIGRTVGRIPCNDTTRQGLCIILYTWTCSWNGSL